MHVDKVSCAFCGAENTATAKFCLSCGKELNPHLGRMNILLMLFLTFITLGIYIPIWFLRKQQAINSLVSTEKLGFGAPIFVLLIYGIDAILIFAPLGITETNMISNLITSIGGIIIIALSFKVRGIFNEHFNLKQQRGIKFSGVATFFFTIFYLQYKINQIEKEQPEKKPSMLWYIVPLIFNLIGGLIGYFSIRDRDKKMAKHILYIGLGMFLLVIVSVSVFLYSFYTVPVPEDIEWDVEYPLLVKEHEEFNIIISVKNTGTETHRLENVDMSDEYLEGIAILSSDPPFIDVMHVQSWKAYYYELDILPGGSLKISFTAKPVKVGAFSGEVWIRTDFYHLTSIRIHTLVERL